MSVDNTLVVPVEVTALAVNRQTRDTATPHVFNRWITNFKDVGQGVPPEPEPFSGSEDWNGDENRLGLYLQWELPAALTRGRHDDEEGVGDFPLVPNRWLVVRHRQSDHALKAWIVESDYLDPMDGSVSFQDPDSTEAAATLIGKCHELNGPWQEPASPHAPFLTAIGPGLLTFSVFQPYNKNVFSMHDTLQDVPGQERPERERLSYFVAGWYADPASDILAHADDLTALLGRLGWTRPAGSGSGIRSSVYTGTVLGVDWDLTGPVPDSDCPTPDKVTAVVSNSIAEAIAELGAQADGEGAFTTDDAELFRAFLLGGIDALEERDRPEAGILTDRRAHDTAFGPVPGGYRWFIGERGEETGRSVSRTTRAAEAETVADLNRKQAEHDATEADLDAARENLYHLWWLSRLDDQPNDFPDRVNTELDPANPDGAAGRVAALARRLAEQRNALPWGKTEADLAASIDALHPAYGTRAARRLIRVPAQDYEYSADPVLTLQGANLHAPLTRPTALPCRTPERLVTAASGITTTDVAAVAAQIDLTNQPPCFPALLTEFLILDRALENGPINDVTGTLPEYGTTAWRMPWQPLYLLWKAQYFPIPFRDGESAHWDFVERSRYQWNGTGEPGEPLVVSGRQILAPTAGHIIEGTLRSYARVRDQLPADTVRQIRSDAAASDMLSQALDGFGAAIAQRQALAGLQPTGTVADLVGNGDYPPPNPGGIPASDWDPWPASTFQELRAGQLAFLDLAVVDRFGRSVNLIGEPEHFRPEMPATMRPAHQVSGYDSARLVELGPRLLQPARLRFDFLSATTDDDTDLTPGANPICAWLLHNRLDQSLVVYTPDGAALGELRVTLNEQGQHEVSWSALPGSDVTGVGQLDTHTSRLLNAVMTSPQTFDAFRATLDRTLQTIDPDGPADPGLGFLLGRPLALVRTRLTMELRGPLRTDVSWQSLFDPPQPQLPHYPWAIRLGEAEQSDDGLIGYVLNDNYQHFETVIEPADGSDGYLRPIGDNPSLDLDFGDHATAVATVLMDPRAAVHATTDILSTKRVFVPQEFTDQAIARMAVHFRTGPLLAATTTLRGPADEVEETVLMPTPAGVTGAWTWSETRAGTWEKLPILTQDQYDLPLAEPEIRSGFLTLDDAVTHSRTDH
ncbi:hypothetical protein QNO09_31515 [Streptomyces sp. 378]|uniref:hypothetical protein n=1 Tax=Streptomyces sp. 378 TaxID=3049412 RepID=UPI0024C46474|nr:hypothetical protein [Streptomyces sp. 378]MDK1347734.1 hypothetical protein [Streptomyces sp. 378]